MPSTRGLPSGRAAGRGFASARGLAPGADFTAGCRVPERGAVLRTAAGLDFERPGDGRPARGRSRSGEDGACRLDIAAGLDRAAGAARLLTTLPFPGVAGRLADATVRPAAGLFRTEGAVRAEAARGLEGRDGTEKLRFPEGRDGAVKLRFPEGRDGAEKLRLPEGRLKEPPALREEEPRAPTLPPRPPEGRRPSSPEVSLRAGRAGSPRATNARNMRIRCLMDHLPSSGTVGA
ncbi:MAG: hypothetical protein FJ098_05305 [Deltaproteobacteria bacterium]|nr:hypothetical protein [Deltaproteobacteria bacterium]